MKVRELKQVLETMNEEAEVAARIRIPSVFGEQFIFADFNGWSKDSAYLRLLLTGSARIVQTPIKAGRLF